MMSLGGSVRSRLLKGAGATAFGVSVTLAVQVVSVPLFLHGFGVQLYGEWLLLSAVPAYLSVSDFGFAAVGANEMTMRTAVGDRAGAIRVLRSVWVVITMLSIGLCGAAVFAAALLEPSRFLPIRLMSENEVIVTLALLSAYVVLVLQTGVVEGGFRCIGRFPRGTAISATLRATDFLAVVSAVLVGLGPVGVAGAQLSSRLCGFGAAALLLKLHAPWLTLGIRGVDLRSVRRLVRPALGFVGFPIGNASSLQGMILVVGATLGPAAVVVLNAARTMTNAGRQLIGVVYTATWPELTNALATSNLPLARRLHGLSVRSTLAFASGSGVVVVATGPLIVDVWTGNSISVDRTLLSFLVIVMVLDAAWLASSVVLVSVNRHTRMALIYVLSALAALGVAVPCVEAFGLKGVPLALALIDVAMLFYVTRATPPILGDPGGNLVREFARAVFTRRVRRSRELERSRAN